jgi:hypothetical protein
MGYGGFSFRSKTATWIQEWLKIILAAVPVPRKLLASVPRAAV